MSRTTEPQLLVLLLSVAGWCKGEPILPSLAYPVFILSPPDALKPEPGQQYHPLPEHQFHTVSDQVPPSYPPAPAESGYEVSQFHSQDELGRVVYGFYGPDQSRMEARSLDGSVRGSYSYIDPNGNIVRMQYWDDGSGFHVTGNALPNGIPMYTPEVAAARAQHLKIYQAALQAAGHMVPPSVNDGNDIDHATVLQNNFDENMSQLDKETNANNLYSEDSDTISLDNPDLYGNINYQPEENKEEQKPVVGQLEGEVELGEEVGPDEDENEEENFNEEQEDKEHQEREYFKKANYNEKGNSDTKDVMRFKIVKDNEDVPKKFFHKQKYQEKEKEISGSEQEPINEDNHEEQEDENDHDNHEDDHKSAEEHDAEDHDEEEEETDTEEHEVSDGHDNENKDDEEENIEESVDEHFDTIEHMFHPDGFEESPYRRADYRSRAGSEEGYDGSQEHSDAETAENQKSSVSQILSKFGNSEKPIVNGYPGQLSDQNVEKSSSSPNFYEPKRAFFYRFLHTIPRPVERIDDTNEKKSAFSSNNNAQILSKTNPEMVQSYIRSSEAVNTPVVSQPAIIQPLVNPHAHFDEAQQQSNLTPQTSSRQPVALFSPFTEVHDPQVSPLQAGTNPQLFPVYLPEKVR